MLLTSSLPAFARGPSVAPAGLAADRQETSCARITKLADLVQGRLDSGRQKLTDRRDDRTAKLAERRASEDTKRADRRAAWENRWKDLIGRLETDGATDTSAVAAFKASMEAAWVARDAAIDAADKVFRDGLDALLVSRQASVENATLAYKTAAAAAFAKAESDCASGVPIGTVLSGLRASLKAAQDKFRADRQSIDKIGEKVKALVTARQAAVEKAKADFKAAAEKAREAFKAALGATMSATGTKEAEGGQPSKDASETLE